ncbi:MAG: protein translocase subunit SecD [Propionibacteriaceae bacterium]|nr:protein translocase subunit SecD [Propionibacteriaceae bacterium]
MAIYAIMVIAGTWTPRLGLDLRGGTTVTLTARESEEIGSQVPAPTTSDAQSSDDPATSASDDPAASASDDPKTSASATPTTSSDKPEQSQTEAMDQAVNIIRQRVDSLGVGETNVQKAGTNQIEVQAPNIDPTALVELVGQTAKLGFRTVYSYDYSYGAVVTTDPSDTATPSPSADASLEPGDDPSGGATSVTTTPSSPTPTGPAMSPLLPTAPTSPRPTAPGENANTDFDSLLKWQPAQRDLDDFSNWDCGNPFPNVWDQPLFACDDTGFVKYLLGPVIIQGESVVNSTALLPSGQLSYVVTLEFESLGAQQFQAATAYLATQASPKNQFAIVLDAEVVSAPSVSQAIANGSATISGSGITAETSQALARVLRYGALPLSFDVSSVDTVSPTLGGEQLRVGIVAGLIGLALVLLYCVIYYRALSLVIVSSLVAAGVITYGVIVLLGEAIGFALNLPGIAGVIMAIGVTADSFIVYFERIRDDVREGFSLQHAIESGWDKARGTIVIADSVQLLSALVLFILAIGSVRGFAFTLLVSTAIDLFIVFFFTKPIVTVIGRVKFFKSGHPWSGFDPEHLGVTVEMIQGVRSARTMPLAGKEA